MESITQTLPRMEPGHVSTQVLPRVEGEGIHDDVVPSEYPKWIQHRGMGPIQVQNADEEAMRVAESDALPEPPPPTEQEIAKTKLEKIVGRPLTDLESLGSVFLLSLVDEKNTIVYHPDAVAMADENARIAAEYGFDLSTLPPVPEAPAIHAVPEVEHETKVYADGSRASGPAPLPDVSLEGAPVVETAAEPEVSTEF